MIEFTGRIILAFILRVNSNSKMDSKIAGRVTLEFILPAKF